MVSNTYYCIHVVREEAEVILELLLVGTFEVVFDNVDLFLIEIVEFLLARFKLGKRLHN